MTGRTSSVTPVTGKRMGIVEIVIGVGLMILSVAFYGMTFQFPQQTLAFSPKIFPRFVSICLFIISGILVIQGIRAFRRRLPDEPSKPTIDKTFLTRLLFSIFIGYAYTQLLPVTGYVVATPPFIAGIMIVFNERRWMSIGTCALITTGVLYFLFRMVFKVPLPRFGWF